MARNTRLNLSVSGFKPLNKPKKDKYKALAKWRNTVYFYANVLKHRSKNVKIISPKKETLPDIALDKVDIPGMDVPRIPKR